MIQDMIRKVKGGYVVLSESGKKLGGPYKTRAEAEKRLRQVEYFKHQAMRCVREFGDIERSAPNAPPSAFMIWKAGENQTDKGLTIFSERSAQLLMEEQANRGNLYSIDIDHQSLSPVAPLENRRAVGWHKLEVRNGDLWAIECEWSDFVAAGLQADPPEWKYFSPAYDVDPETREVVCYCNTALTINPATWNVTALASRDGKGTQRDSVMTKAELMTAIEHMQNSEDASAVAKALMAMYGPGKKDQAESDEEDVAPPPPAPKDEGGDEVPPSEKKEEPVKDSLKVAASNASEIALAERVQALEAQIAAKAEQEERERLLATRPDLVAEVRSVLERASLETLRDAVKRFPKVAASKVMKPEAPVRGEGQKSEQASLEPDQKMSIQRAMGLGENKHAVKREGNTMVFTVADYSAPKGA